MTKEELEKKIEEAADRYLFQYCNPFRVESSDIPPTLAPITSVDKHFKAGAEFGIRLEREAAQELVEALKSNRDQVQFMFNNTQDGERFHTRSRIMFESMNDTLTRWRERTKG